MTVSLAPCQKQGNVWPECLARNDVAFDEGIFTASLNYTYIISTHATFKEKILVETGDTNTYSESETSLKMKINGNLASKITYTVKNNSKVPVGAKETDKITTIALVYGF